ncbi:MAG TPA: pyruvate kinase [Spirochaetia bacterium]|nr:pyruvate kinase [Spirochaetia bacterium]
MSNNRLTKIVATLGPTSDSPELIEEMIKSGVNVFRFNTKHGTTQWHEERICRVQEIANKLKVNVGIMVDLQGPEIRLETIDKMPFSIRKNQPVKITPSFIAGVSSICIPHKLLFTSVKPGNHMLVDDGNVELIIESVSLEMIVATPTEDGEIGHKKGANFPGVAIDLPSLIHEDLNKLDMATTNKIDFFALSFSRTKADIEILRKEMSERGVKAMIMAKIESLQALEHLDELIEATDAVMVARGDLGVEVPIEQLAYWQKIIIGKCRVANKPVVTATQMLESMTNNPRPTRAEATDVANAVLDGTDALMLSGETANGCFPVKAVQEMSRIAEYNEQIYPLINFTVVPKNETDIIVNATKELLNQRYIKLKMILVFTRSGLTAKSISRLRPKIPVIAFTSDQKTVEELSLSYAVRAIKTEIVEEKFSLPNSAIENLVKTGELAKGDAVVVIHGQSFYKEGSTNAVALLKI